MNSPNDYSPEFDMWMQRLDRHLEAVIGLSHMDLPDRDYMSMFESEAKPDCVAESILDSMYSLSSPGLF
jgi:hypothetical protein